MGGTYAILVAGNLGAEAVRIEDNDTTVRGKGWAFGISGEELNITGNHVRFEKLDGKDPAGAVSIGFGMLGQYDLGASLVDSVFENSTFDGTVTGDGVRFGPSSENMPNKSHGNRFDMGDSLAKLGAKTTLTLSKNVYGNVFKGDLGKVVDDAPKGVNDYWIARQGWRLFQPSERK